jgi:hypothetical protein
VTQAQQWQLEGFRSQLIDDGRTIWIGSPLWESAVCMFEELSEIDPQFELVKDPREARKIKFEAPGPTLNTTETIIEGASPLHPVERWKMLPASRAINLPFVTYIVQRIVTGP